MTATEAVLRARRAAQIAQHQLDRHPHFSLDRQQALQLIRAIGELAGQINELNRIAFHLECELHYADEADAARRTSQ